MAGITERDVQLMEDLCKIHETIIKLTTNIVKNTSVQDMQAMKAACGGISDQEMMGAFRVLICATEGSVGQMLDAAISRFRETSDE